MLRHFARLLRISLQHSQVLGGHLGDLLLHRDPLQCDNRRPDPAARQPDVYQRLHHLALLGANSIQNALKVS